MDWVVYLLVYQWVGLQVIGFYWLGLTGRLDSICDWLNGLLGIGGE